MKIPNNPFFGTYYIGRKEKKAVDKVIKSKSLFRYQGPNLQYVTDQFEEAMKRYLNVKYVLACSNGGTALKLSCIALGIGIGDEVLVPSFTFIASASNILAVGAVPKFVDIDETMNIDPKSIEQNISERTKAIMVVHMQGSPANMKEIMKIAKKHNLKVIEDTAQALGAELNGKKVGTFGDCGAFSLQAGKTITCGEGGFFVTNNKDLYIRSSSAEFLIFEQQKKEHGIEVRFEDGDLWLTQKALGELYNTSKQDISYHLSNIFKELELEQNSVVKNYLTTASDGKKYKTNYYNLDAVISVGYRVNTDRAIQFRRWATNVLKEFSKKGYIIDKKRMENGTFFDEDYFESLLAEIREIRLSERRFYQKITDIYATSIDYDSKSPTTIKFFKKVQNKMHYAVTHQTAAEIIYNRADHTKEHMNLTNWKNSPNGKILETDVVIAKNYLKKEELEQLELIVSAFLDLAEARAKRNIPMTMEDWANRIDKYLLSDDRDVLKDAGKISHEIAKEKALTEFEKYRVVQDKLYKSDFDKLIESSEN